MECVSKPLLSLWFAAAAASGAASHPAVLWHNPGRVETLDFIYGAGGRANAPRAPFTFLEEPTTGSNPKIKVRDANGNTWSVKFGEEAKPETFASRVAWATGYYVEPMYFVRDARIHRVGKLKRAQKFVDREGDIQDARFQLWQKGYKFLKEPSWTWSRNPFAGTRELNGLKIIMMLTSNWDNKDARDSGRDSNTAIMQHGPRWIYFIADWGGSMGKWGRVYSRDKWDCIGYTEQTPKFVKGVQNGLVEWGYHGQRTDDAVKDIRVSDVRWLLQYLGRITDNQLRAGLAAGGATAAEATCFTGALRARIRQLQAIASQSPLISRRSHAKPSRSQPLTVTRIPRTAGPSLGQ